MKSNMMIWGLIGIVIIGVGGYYIVSRQPAVAPESADVMVEETMEKTEDAMVKEEGDAMVKEEGDVMEKMDGEVRVIEVEGGAFYYKPNEIRVKKGQKVRIVLNSVDMQHDFKIDELNVATPVIRGGQTASVEFTPDQVGEFEFYCSVNSHRANGMFGTLIVEE